MDIKKLIESDGGFKDFLHNVLQEEASQDGDEDLGQFGDMSAQDLYDYLRDNYDYDDDTLMSAFGIDDDSMDNDYWQSPDNPTAADKFLRKKAAEEEREFHTDVDGDGNIDMTAVDKDGDGDADEVTVKKGKGSAKAERTKSSILDDYYKAETPEEIDIRKMLGVGGKFKPETKEEQEMLDSTGTVSDSDESDDSSWADIVGALKDRRY